MRTCGGVHPVEVQNCQEVYGSEVPVDGWGSADFGSDGEVGAEESGEFLWCRGEVIHGALAGRPGVGLELRGGEVVAGEVGIGGCADLGVLGGEGAASEEVVCAVLAGVVGDAFPEQVEGAHVSM